MKRLFYTCCAPNVCQILQRVRIACTALIARSCLSVWPSIRPVTFQCFLQTNEDTIVRSSVSGKIIIVVTGEVMFIRVLAGGYPSEGVKGKHILLLAKIWQIISHILETVKIGGKLVLITNRKSHMSFRLVPKSVTLDGVMAFILHNIAEFNSFRGPLLKSGWRYTDTFCDRNVAQSMAIFAGHHTQRGH